MCVQIAGEYIAVATANEKCSYKLTSSNDRETVLDNESTPLFNLKFAANSKVRVSMGLD